MVFWFIIVVVFECWCFGGDGWLFDLMSLVGMFIVYFDWRLDFICCV